MNGLKNKNTNRKIFNNQTHSFWPWSKHHSFIHTHITHKQAFRWNFTVQVISAIVASAHVLFPALVSPLQDRSSSQSSKTLPCICFSQRLCFSDFSCLVMSNLPPSCPWLMLISVRQYVHETQCLSRFHSRTHLKSSAYTGRNACFLFFGSADVRSSPFRLLIFNS